MSDSFEDVGPFLRQGAMEPWDADDGELARFAQGMAAQGVTIGRDENNGVTYEVAMQVAREMSEGPMDATANLDDRNFQR